MSKRQYVKEVQNVINLGVIDKQTVLKMYDEIGQNFVNALEEEDGRQYLRDRRKHRLKEWHEDIDYIVKQYDERLSWRNVKVEPNRFKICPLCYKWFYDKARNGKTLTCDYVVFKEWDFVNRKFKYWHDPYGNRMSVCAVELDKRRRAAKAAGVDKYTIEDLLWPYSGRSVQEIPVDMQPSVNDRKGQAILQEMQRTYNDY